MVIQVSRRPRYATYAQAEGQVRVSPRWTLLAVFHRGGLRVTGFSLSIDNSQWRRLLAGKQSAHYTKTIGREHRLADRWGAWVVVHPSMANAGGLGP